VLPHTIKIVIGGNHDRAPDAKCETRDASIYNDLYKRRECRAEFREGEKSDIIYLEDQSTDATIGGWSYKVFGSPKSLATSTNTAFGHLDDDSFSWEIIPPGVDILVTHGPPTWYLSDDKNGRDGLRRALRRFAHCFMSLGTCTLPTGLLLLGMNLFHRFSFGQYRLCGRHTPVRFS